MLAACESYLPVDIMVAAAAVSDWRVAQPALQKIKKTSDQQNLHLELVRNPDILATIAHLPKGQRPKLVIGFAAETENLVENAQSKRQKKQCDWILANPVDRDNQPFASLDNKITFVTGSSQEQWPKMTKQQIAIKLVEKMVAFFHSS